MDYYSPFWGPEAISIVVEPKDALTCRSSTLAVLADSGPFCGLLLAVSGPGGISTIDEPLVRLCFGHQQSRFLSIMSLSWTITHRFRVLKRFPLLSNPKVCLVLVVKSRSFGRFWPVSWIITQFWGPDVISTIDEPRGCVYVSVINTHNFGQFWPSHGLLLTVLGSQSDFHD